MAKELEKSLEKVSQEVSKATEEVKETMHDVGGRWKKSSREEIIITIIGIILVARGLRKLREFIWGVVLLILGGLLISGYFNTAIKVAITSFKNEKKAGESVAKKTSKTTKK
ncbi:MAG: hypothetical protein LBP53_04350 [Candidatus Peribacteria bacterium]|jgi:hypothetical protein|nr:hypothetical protein [Candidatus Peribacteria bacterium]